MATSELPALLAEARHSEAEQISKTLTKTLDNTAFQAAVLQGVALNRFYDKHAKRAVIAAGQKVLAKVRESQQDELVKAKFVGLLNLRRLLNLISGVKEDYLDKLTDFEDFAPLDPDRIDITDLVSYSYDGTLVAKLNVDQAKCDTLQKMVVQNFMAIIDKVRSGPAEYQFGKETNSPDASSDHKSLQQLYEGSKTYQDLKKEVLEANSKIQNLKLSLKTRDEHLDKMKSTLLKDVVHLRETVGVYHPSCTAEASSGRTTKRCLESTTSRSPTWATKRSPGCSTSDSTSSRTPPADSTLCSIESPR